MAAKSTKKQTEQSSDSKFHDVLKPTDVSVIADMEEGYGNAISLMDAVRDFEAAGLAGVHIDDEALPSKCPFLPGIPRNQLITVDEMCGKVRAAIDAREDANFKIIVRTDVIGTVPLDDYYHDNRSNRSSNEAMRMLTPAPMPSS